MSPAGVRAGRRARSLRAQARAPSPSMRPSAGLASSSRPSRSHTATPSALCSNTARNSDSVSRVASFCSTRRTRSSQSARGVAPSQSRCASIAAIAGCTLTRLALGASSSPASTSTLSRPLSKPPRTSRHALPAGHSGGQRRAAPSRQAQACARRSTRPCSSDASRPRVATSSGRSATSEWRITARPIRGSCATAKSSSGASTSASGARRTRRSSACEVHIVQWRCWRRRLISRQVTNCRRCPSTVIGVSSTSTGNGARRGLQCSHSKRCEPAAIAAWIIARALLADS